MAKRAGANRHVGPGTNNSNVGVNLSAPLAVDIRWRLFANFESISSVGVGYDTF